MRKVILNYEKVVEFLRQKGIPIELAEWVEIGDIFYPPKTGKLEKQVEQVEIKVERIGKVAAKERVDGREIVFSKNGQEILRLRRPTFSEESSIGDPRRGELDYAIIFSGYSWRIVAEIGDEGNKAFKMLQETETFKKLDIEKNIQKTTENLKR